MKILFYTNIPSPYRVDFFNELGKYCDLTVLFEIDKSTERDAKWDEYQFTNFKGVILKGIRTRVDSAFCPGILRYINRSYDYVIISVLSSITALMTVAYMKIRKIPYCFEGDGGYVGTTKGLKSTLKRFVIGGAKLCFSTSKEFDKYCMAYGAEEKNIRRYPFTSVYENDVIKTPMSKTDKQIAKRDLGIHEKIAIISVGQFIYRKGFDLLLQVSRKISDEVGIYIVGGEPTEEYLQMREKWKLDNVHFLPFMEKNQLVTYYQAADLFVLFTREDIWGLVINEAMANGLPVISTDRCVAALELVKQDVNGLIVQSENVEEMIKAVQSLISSEEIRRKMAHEAVKCVRDYYTIESMAREHLKVFTECS